VGQHFRVFYPPELQASRHPEHELEVALREGHYEEEGWRVRKDGSRFWANVLITAVFNESGEHVGFAKVTRDTSERRRLEQEREHAVAALAAANEKLEALNSRLQQAADDQAQFLAVTAHELRTPIGVLGGSADTLSKHWPDLTDEERRELLDAMGSSTGRLRRLIADLLTASRLQSSALRIQPAPIRVQDVVSDAVATVESTSPGVGIIVEGASDAVVHGDRDRLAQALDNLLANGLRHGTAPVTVAVHEAGDTVELRVTDQGKGVDPGMQSRLFERFATGHGRGGTGLGLFIVRELARAHGGDAFYEHGTPERPSGAFVIRLPVASSLSTHSLGETREGSRKT
jgi:signal transduction histidine kinase